MYISWNQQLKLPIIDINDIKAKLKLIEIEYYPIIYD